MPQVDLGFAQFKSFVDQLQNPQHIELQGEGEPMLHPDFFAMVQYLREQFPAAKISTITNGSLLTDEKIRALLTTPVDSLMISIESAEEKLFQDIRGGKLERVRRGVKRLMAQKRLGGFTKPTVGLTVTLLSSTINGLSEIADFYDDLQLDGGILLQPLQSMENYSAFYDLAMRENLLTAEDRNTANRIIASSANLRSMLARYQQQTHFYSQLYRSVHPSNCPWLANGLYVAADGSLVSCCFIKKTQDHKLGDVGSRWSEIAAKRAQLADQLSQGIIPEQCSACGVAKKMQAEMAKLSTADI